ncbi:MAG: preprotein translocase subunit Sec61beta [Candidatus Bathyarchaeia archaeon]
MSRVRKKREGAPMPSTAAGLLRFYEEESFGVKIRPEVVVVAAVALAVIVALAPFLFP